MKSELIVTKWLGCIALLLCYAMAGSARAQQTLWVNPTVGNWTIASNWNPIVPQSASIAEINNGGLALINTPGAVADFLYLGFSSPDSGYLDVNGGNLTLGARLGVDNGELQVLNGGRVVVLNDPHIGNETEVAPGFDAATLLVTGTNSYLSSGSLFLGTGSTFNATGVATFRIESGGRVDTTTAYAVNGTTNVTGTNSLWSISGVLHANSPITVSNHGTVNAGYAAIAGNDTLTVTGAGSSLHNTSPYTMTVGYVGTGGLSVQNGGLVTDANADVGYRFSPADTGTVAISGAGSTWNNSNNLTIGGSTAENGSGTGTMTVSSGGRVTAATAQLGLLADSVGTATVTGAGSTWAASSDIVVGQSGSGTMNVTNGGKVTSLRGHVGFNTNSSGSVVVSDNGSSWTASGSYFIGNGGSGSLQVLNAGLANTAGNSYLGFSPGATGTGLVSGLGSTWKSTGTLAVGGNLAAAGGQGTMRIENGGSVSAAAVLLYNTGALELSGATTLAGPITSYGGVVRTFGATALANNITLGAGGIYVANETAGGVSNFSGTITGNGALVAIGSAADATLRLTGNSSYSGATVVNSGTLLVDGSVTSTVTVQTGATLGGSGTVGPLNIDSGGTISPGNSPGALTAANTVLSGGARFALELRSDGTGTAGVDWDSLAVNGTLDISALAADNTLVISLHTLDSTNAQSPLEVWDSAVNHTWSSIISTTTGFVGDFDSTLVQVDATGFQSPTSGAFSVVQDGANLDLQYIANVITPPVMGDYSQNGVVDAADYVMWRATLGQSGTGLAADGDGNGIVDEADYDFWVSHFGETEATGTGESASSAVPEPETLSLIVSLLFCISLKGVRLLAFEVRVPSSPGHS